MESNSEIVEWYKDKTIFITGGTGFMGKVLIEKILRTCEVRKIYLLIRPKKNVEVKQRLDNIFSFQLFDRVKSMKPGAFQKVHVVKGDISMEGLGLSDEDESILAREVSVVFHVAATINFQEPMRVAVNMNVLGTKRVVNLSKKMDNLKALVHVSTAYGNCHLTELLEEMYPPPIEPGKLVQMTEWLDDEHLNTLTPKLIYPRPNTYTYTKAIAEHVLIDDGPRLPAVIVRPSIVCGAWREPVPGWVDNIFAFTGLLIAMGKGFLRSVYMKPGIKVDFIPVDIAINVMLVAAWNADTKKHQPNGPLPIYNVCSSSEKPLSADQLEPYLRKIVWRVPLDSPVWFPDGSKKTSRFLHNLHVFLVNVLPCYIGDLVLRLIGKKPVAMKICNKMMKAISVLEYFMLRDWTFCNKNVRGLWSTISLSDQKAFHFDISQLEWAEYIENYQIGCKKYIMKEDLKNLPTAKRTLRILYWFHRIFQLLLAYGAWCIVSSDTATNIYSSFLDTASYCLSLAPLMAAAEEVQAS